MRVHTEELGKALGMDWALYEAFLKDLVLMDTNPHTPEADGRMRFHTVVRSTGSLATVTLNVAYARSTDVQRRA